MVVVDRFDIEKVKGYTIMPNYHQRDRTLSIKAKGILSQMFSLPEGWDYTLRGLAYLNTDGIDSMRSGIRELERAGYIERRRTRDEHGKLRGTVYKVYCRKKLNREQSRWPSTQPRCLPMYSNLLLQSTLPTARKKPVKGL